jgi:hypothetical protein
MPEQVIRPTPWMMLMKLKLAAQNLRNFHANNACDLQEVRIVLISCDRAS